MINIPTKSKAPFDKNNISSINAAVSHGAVTAQNVESINSWKVQESTAAGSNSGQPGARPASTYPAQGQPAARPMTPSQAPTQAAPRPVAPSAQPGYPYQAQTGYQNQTQPAYQAGSSSGQAQPAYQAGDSSNQVQQAYQAGNSTSQPPHMAPAMPVQKPVPQLMKPVQKGQKVTMGVGTPLTALKACFGWNSTNAQCDVDVSAFMLGNDGKVIGDEWFVFYGQTNSPDNSTTFQMDNGADREIIHINLQTLNPAVKKIVFVLTINEAVEKHLHFGMMKDAYVRILNPGNNTELVSFKMTDYYSNVISMMIGEVYQHNGTWKFNAVGNGVAKDLLGLCELYGVQVID